MPTKNESESDSKLPRFISHYTTLEGLKGIITSKALWASNASFLNDASELEHALKESKKVIKDISSEETFKEWASLLQRVFQDLTNGVRPDTYVTCFCRDDDNLSQWRGYGGAVQGVSLTFSRAKLERRFKGDGSAFIKVKYSKYSTALKLKRAVKGQLAEIANLNEMNEDLNYEEKYGKLFSRVSALLPRFKHIGFKDEREWRFYFQDEIENDKILFRVSNNKVVPYIVVGESKDLLPITSVRVGPGPDQILTAKSIQVFLKANSYDVPVKTSEVPFRL